MRNKLILVLLLFVAVAATAKKKTEADFDVTFTVTATLPNAPFGHSYYCPMTLQTAGVAYNVYSQSFQCATFSVGTEVNGRWKQVPQLMRYDQGVEMMYFVKGKLHSHLYVVSASQAVP